MLKKGNSRPEVCASNLINLFRPEVPYARRKGLDPAIIDQPSSHILAEAKFDISWTLKTFEPRVDINKVDINSLTSKSGDFLLNTDLKVK